MGVAVVFTQAYQVTPQWKYYDDIFRGHYNIRGTCFVSLMNDSNFKCPLSLIFKVASKRKIEGNNRRY